MSNVWLLSWNPDKWNWKEYSAWCTGTKNKEKFTESWTCRSKKPSVGDEFFLIKQGERPRGIIGHGHIVRESYIAPHYDAERAKKGDWPNHVDAEFDWLLNGSIIFYVGLPMPHYKLPIPSASLDMNLWQCFRVFTPTATNSGTACFLSVGFRHRSIA